MLLQNIVQHLETIAPISYQEPYDNAGLILGDKNREISSALITLDVTEEVVDEAISLGCELIISHHPLIFKGIKRITGSNEVERCLIKAIRNDLAIYAAHTNLDSITGGVNSIICDKIGLVKCHILSPAKNQLIKLITYIPEDHLEAVRSAIFSAGAGIIGNYDQCSYSAQGSGTFRGNEESNPYVGIPGALHTEQEIRFETIVPRHLISKVVAALNASHPYEEVAYDLVPLENDFQGVGMGMIGELTFPSDELKFLQRIKGIFGCQMIKHTTLLGQKISKIAVCGGSGSFLVSKAIAEGADLFISADFKYHDFFEADNKIVLADIGHYESEQFTKEVLKEIVLKKFPTFALHLSNVKTNPVSYL
ncbi:MAG: Nif3-like dinuclear metal center hexameric protein [Prolixibacteraceae bacterium]|jgi:dinuclear metal center YbgI/SA1388 family protein|nr:Nif3-like dinuclear metal center hexameric protein [Prolixibacteraceae bacterium]